jgi:uncharacterized membrane protein YhaH (DUF805 family)
MGRLWFWFVFGVFFTLSIMMIVFGILFIRDVYYSGNEVAFGSLIIGVVLLLAGGGLLSSTVAETVRKLLKK